MSQMDRGPTYFKSLTVIFFLFHASRVYTEICSSGDQCEHGKCLLGNSSFCVCDGGYGGEKCDEKLCNNTIACNGKGFCLGTETDNICICNDGFRGDQCEVPTNDTGIIIRNRRWLSKAKPMKWQLPTKLRTPTIWQIPQIPLKLPPAPPKLQASPNLQTLTNLQASCSPAECNNKGLCVGTKERFQCLCFLGYSGSKCEKNIFATVTFPSQTGQTIVCSPMDCNKRGVCIGTKASFSCICQIGYVGRRCERTTTDTCNPAMCSNNGLCIGATQTPTCFCYPGYAGRYCESITDTPCDSSDCNDKGVCMGTKSNYICACSPGFLGQRCELVLSADLKPQLANALCDLSDCNNNGICIGSKGNPVCLCSLGYKGTRCEYDPPCISSLQCSNRGICLGSQKQFVCICSAGWGGQTCNILSSAMGLGKQPMLLLG